MEKLKKIGRAVYKVYLGIGIAAVALMALCVIYAVIARYFFGISHTFLEEFITTVFAFTTFWGLGICTMENEHVVIDSFYTHFPAGFKKYVTIFNHLVVFVVLGIMIRYGFQYAGKFGSQISMGMRVPMVYMYGIIPVGCVIGFVCQAIKFVEFICENFGHKKGGN